MTIRFQLACASVKSSWATSALEEGLNCFPQPLWSCLENLITFSFKLCDNFGCLCYGAMALKRYPSNQKSIEYKSKVYMEIPSMQEYTKEENFVQ